MFLKRAKALFSRINLRIRLALIFVAIFGTTTIFFNTFLFTFTMQTLQQDFDDALFNYAVDTSESIDIGVKGDLNFPPLKLDDGKILPFPLGTALIQVRHISGAVLAQVGNFGDFDPPYKKDFEHLARGEEATFRTIENISKIPSAEADSYRVIAFPLDSSAKPQLILQIAVPMTLLDTQISNRLKTLQIGIPLILFIATLGGIYLSARALAPVKQMTQIAQSIDATELNKRVPVPLANDEIKALAETLNKMLDRIQRAFQSQERFIADASHQLLTPLTIMRSEVELLQKSETKDIQQFTKSTLQEIDNLSAIVREMLLLARIDAGLGALNLQSLSMDELIMEAMTHCQKLAKNKNIHLKFTVDNSGLESAPLVKGDKDLLDHLLVNIIENAIKYSPVNKSVSILLTWKTDSTAVQIQDEGPGIPQDLLPVIFERFSRGAKADLSAKGHGLGLAIANKIAILHGSKLFAENVTPHGARFKFEIKNI